MSRPAISKLRLEKPDGWTEESMIALVGPETGHGHGRPSVLFTTEPAPDGELEALLKEKTRELSREVEDFHAFAPSERFVAGRTWKVLGHTFVKDSLKLRQEQLHAVFDRSLYVVTLTHLAEGFEEARSHFDRVLETLRLGD